MINGENISLGFRDLLFNSGVACLLLFIIFSVKIGSSSISAGANNKSNKDFEFFDKQSLILDETKKKGNYSSIFAVEIRGINKEIFNALFNAQSTWLKPKGITKFYLNHQSNTLTIYGILKEIKSEQVGFVIGNNELDSLGIKEMKAKLLDGVKNAQSGLSNYQTDSFLKNLANNNEILIRVGNNEDNLSNQKLFIYE